MNPHSQITTLFLDIGGVLLTNGWDHNIRIRAAEKFGLNSVYIDDRAMFVEVARNLGINGIIHTGYAATRTSLEGLGLK